MAEKNKPNKRDIEDNDEPQEDPLSFLIYESNNNISDDSLKPILAKIHQFNLVPSTKVLGVLKQQEQNFCGYIIAPVEENKTFCEFVSVDSRYPHFSLHSLIFATKKKVVGLINKVGANSELFHWVIL